MAANNNLPLDPRPIPKASTGNDDDDNTAKTIPTDEQVAAEGSNETWNQQSGCFRIITDSLSLQQILTGHYVYHGQELYETFFQIDEIIRSWHGRGWKPAITGGTPIDSETENSTTEPTSNVTKFSTPAVTTYDATTRNSMQGSGTRK